MTGISSKVVIAGVATLALAACGSSPPSPMQKWQAGQGGKCLAQVEKDLTATGSDFESEAHAVWIDAINCASSDAPPVGGALYTTVMGDISSAALFGGAAASGQMGGDTATSLTDGSNSLSRAEALLKNAPSADTWALVLQP